MEVIEEQPVVYAIYCLDSKEIRYPVFDTLSEAKQNLELTIIYFYNNEIEELENEIELLERKIMVLKREEELKNKPKAPAPAKKPVKKGAKKEETESVSSSESPYESSDDEYSKMSLSELEDEFKKLNKKHKNKYEILVAVRDSLKIVEFKIT